jgi:PAS domain-containing protein
VRDLPALRSPRRVGQLVHPPNLPLSDTNSREEVAARALTWRALTPPEHVAQSERRRKFLEATGRIGPYEKEYFRKDGSRAWLVFAGIGLADGTVVKYALDITEKKRAKRRWRQAA